MEKLSLLTADLLDILFEGRNKNYGAYELRRGYPVRIAYALAGTFCICLLFAGGAIWAGAKKAGPEIELVTSIELENFPKEEPKQELPPPPKQEPPKVEMSRFNPPLITRDENVTEADEIKDVEQLENTRIGTIDQDGIKDDEIVAAPVENTTRAVTPPREAEDYEKEVFTVQIAAQFPGGPDAWRKYLERSLNSDLPHQNGAPAASYTVIVSFIVDKSGTISDVRTENDPGYGTAAEAIRVIQRGPHWKPAIQNGHEVIYRQKQKVTFRVEEER